MTSAFQWLRRILIYGLGLAVLAVIAALQAVTHSDFYAELERLNMDNHQH